MANLSLKNFTFKIDLRKQTAKNNDGHKRVIGAQIGESFKKTNVKKLIFSSNV